MHSYFALAYHELFKTISSSVPILYGPNLTSVHDNWKNHSFDYTAICIQGKKQWLEPDMEQCTGSKLGKKYIKAVYCHVAYLTCMQNTSWEMPGWMRHKLESRLPGEISITSDMQMTPPYGSKWRGSKKPLIKVKEESEKVGLKLNIQKTKIMASSLITSREINEGNSRNSVRLYFWGLQNHCRWWLQPWNWKMLTPWKESYDQPR